MINIPSWLKSFLKPEDVDLIVSAIKEAESKTSGEIVPMIVRRSAAVDHVLNIIVLLLPLIFFISCPTHWLDIFIGFNQKIFIVGSVLVYFLLCRFLPRSSWLQRHLTSEHDKLWQVEMRAEVEFFEAGLHHTKGGTGVLIFLSLMERKVVVLADKSISSRLTPDTWKDVVTLILSGIKQKNLSHGLSEAIRLCGALLAPHFPIAKDDVNEIVDKLIIKE